MYGEMGTIAQVGERLVCHICGRDFLSLAQHVWLAHDISVRGYKEKFGLNRNHSLWVESRRRTQREWYKRSGAEERANAALAEHSEEQRAAERLRTRGQPRSVEGREHIRAGLLRYHRSRKDPYLEAVEEVADVKRRIAEVEAIGLRLLEEQK